ncbi:hypothetical protein ABIE67_009074 [Streptomyces sp. V4I8]|uniref:TetR/AcrR family transcriptional regulator n=1 Tax=Streptomyces sp. V4I8 TaxID=3156469 RepID=UPI00351140A7
MPTGVHLRDARQQLFDAAERVLLRDGPNGLTSRAVTDEAGCAKGVLLTSALATLFGPIPVAIIPLITFRDELRARLRQARSGGGIAILAEAATAVSAYLAAERELGRIAVDADIDSLTLSLVGGGHLLFADRDPGPPDLAAVNKLVTAVIADAVQRRPS